MIKLYVNLCLLFLQETSISNGKCSGSGIDTEYLFTGPTQLKKQLFIKDSDMAASKPIATAATSVVEGHITDLTISQDPKRFPLECNKVALHWLDVSTRYILTISIAAY